MAGGQEGGHDGTVKTMYLSPSFMILDSSYLQGGELLLVVGLHLGKQGAVTLPLQVLWCGL